MKPERRPLAVYAYALVVGLYASWIGAWLLERTLEQRGGLTTAGGKFVYWTALKLLLWVAPSVALIRRAGTTARDTWAGGRWRQALRWGGGIGLGLGMVALSAKALGHRPLFAPAFGWTFVSAVIVSPPVEEITFRGAVLPALLERYRFVSANTLTALFFLGAHLPGWYFQGRLRLMLTDPLGGGLAILWLGWVFGFVAHKSKSVCGSTLAHALNNLFNS